MDDEIKMEILSDLQYIKGLLDAMSLFDTRVKTCAELAAEQIDNLITKLV